MPRSSALLLATLLWTTLVPGLARAERQVHVVEPGEVLGVIAQRYGVTVTDIMSWNELASDRIGIGRRLVVSPETPPEAPAAREGWETTYLVLRGDNVTRIAERVGVTVEALRAANPEMRPDRVRPGQRLRLVGATRVVDHVVRRGETLARIASRYEVRNSELIAWNPALARRSLDLGVTVRVYTDVRISRSESIGAPNAGALEYGDTLPAHRAYVVRDPARAIGTEETVQWIVDAFDAALDADPQMTRVRIHDIGVAGGGRLTGHRSHQSGRDADVAYYRRQCRDGESCFMNRTRAEDLDTAHQWRLFRYWLERDLASAIFVDYALQEPLYEYAQSHGASRAELAEWFQFPRPVGTQAGVIRHFAGHDDHFHVRFVCPRGDESCSEAVHLVARRSEPSSGRPERETRETRETAEGEVAAASSAPEAAAPAAAAAPAPALPSERRSPARASARTNTNEASRPAAETDSESESEPETEADAGVTDGSVDVGASPELTRRPDRVEP